MADTLDTLLSIFDEHDPQILSGVWNGLPPGPDRLQRAVEIVTDMTVVRRPPVPETPPPGSTGHITLEDLLVGAGMEASEAVPRGVVNGQATHIGGDVVHLRYLDGSAFLQAHRAFEHCIAQAGLLDPPPAPGGWLLDRMRGEWSDTTIRRHWDYVTELVPVSVEDRLWQGVLRDTGNEGRSPTDFLRLPEANRAGLNLPEIYALRLYTGPAHQLINKASREFSSAFMVTSFVIDSAVGKLARFTEQCTVFRGLQGRMDPDWVARYRRGDMKEMNLTELGFVSTTTDVCAAREWGGVVIVISCHPVTAGPVDPGSGSGFAVYKTGAFVEWVTQYPGEQEMLWPTFTRFIPVPKVDRSWRELGDEVYEFKAQYMFDHHRQSAVYNPLAPFQYL